MPEIKCTASDWLAVVCRPFFVARLLQREYCLHRKIYFREARDVRGRLTLMREEEKEDKIEVAEGLSQ